MKRRWKSDSGGIDFRDMGPVGRMTFILLALLLGMIFTVGSNHWYADVGTDETQLEEKTIESLRIWYGKGSDEATLYFTDGEKGFVKPYCFTKVIEEEIRKLEQGDVVQIRFYPNNQDILALSSGGTEILNFENAVYKMARYRKQSNYLSLIPFSCAACFIAAWIKEKIQEMHPPEKKGTHPPVKKKKKRKRTH